MDKQIIKAFSLNINGLRTKKKRMGFFLWLKELNADIIFLQETHCHNNKDVKNGLGNGGLEKIVFGQRDLAIARVLQFFLSHVQIYVMKR